MREKKAKKKRGGLGNEKFGLEKRKDQAFLSPSVGVGWRRGREKGGLNASHQSWDYGRDGGEVRANP